MEGGSGLKRSVVSGQTRIAFIDGMHSEVMTGRGFWSVGDFAISSLLEESKLLGSRSLYSVQDF